MRQDEFEKLFQSTIEQIQHLLIVKGGEYAGSEDRLANFKRGAALAGVTPMQCLLVYLSKHYDAIATFIRDDAHGKDRLRSEPIEGRVDDLINYGILLKALLAETKRNQAEMWDAKPVPAQLSSEQMVERMKRAAREEGHVPGPRF